MLKTILSKLNRAFGTEQVSQERAVKELLRENLGLVSVDIFYINDPVLRVTEDKKKEYYKKFYDLCRDDDVMERIKYLINQQVRLNIDNARQGDADIMGGININGMATIKDDFTRMSNSYLKLAPEKPIVEKDYKIF